MTGTVVSNKMTKAIVVSVSRTAKHPIYKKTITFFKKFHVACSDSALFSVGSQVEIKECKPVSKTISHLVVE